MMLVDLWFSNLNTSTLNKKMCACAYANANFLTQIYIFISLNCVCLFVYARLCEPKAANFVSQQKTQLVSQFLA